MPALRVAPNFVRRFRDQVPARLLRVFQTAMFCVAGGSAAWATPVVIGAPFSASPGDFITLQGSGFGAKPRVFFQTGTSGTQTEAPITEGQDNVIAVRVPTTLPRSLYKILVYDGVSAWSAGILVNAPQAHQFSSPDIAPGRTVRIYGRNLLIAGATPSVTLVDTQTNAQLATTVATSASQQFFVSYTAPSGIIAGHTYRANVSNGYASATTQDTVLGHAAGNDYFQIDQAWAYDFITKDGPGYRAGVANTNQADHHIYNVKTDPSLKKFAVGDGVANDAPAIQAAIDLCTKSGGGIVYIPPGTYYLGSGAAGIDIRAGVVVQGHSNSDTTLLFGPRTQQSSSFAMNGIEIPDNAVLTGIADLSLQNIDTTSQKVVNLSTRGGTLSKFFIQRVNWELGSGAAVGVNGDRIAIKNSSFHQLVNHQIGNAATGGQGPIYLDPISNLAFSSNTVKWATDEVLIDDAVNVEVISNHFTRSATDTAIATAAMAAASCCTNPPVKAGDVVNRRLGRQLTMQFGKNVAVIGNTFDVSDGALHKNLNDGETFLNESRGREDMGVVTSANSASVSADSKCLGTCAWNYFPQSIVFVVSGKGAGQWRHIIQKTNNTFTIAQPWDVIPAAGDHFTLAVPSFENAIINANLMSDNPQGISLFTGAFLNTNVSNNRLTNNSGIYLNAYSTPTEFSVSKNIEINSNILTNTNSTTANYINVTLTQIYPNTFWGYSMMGVQVRNNQLTARPGTNPYVFPEGYQNMVYYQDSTPYVEEGKSALIGNVFQGNSCTNCSTSFSVGTGALDTIIWNSFIQNSPGMASTVLADFVFAASTKTKSIGTVLGHD